MSIMSIMSMMSMKDTKTARGRVKSGSSGLEVVKSEGINDYHTQ